jgi:hypothetical protein
MTPMRLDQHCWNHEGREAACRCPSCGRAYCRECVSEHEGRLLCAACLSGLAARRGPQPGSFRKLAPPAMIAMGILFAWLVYWAAGASLIGLVDRLSKEPPLSLIGHPGAHA